MLFSGPRTRAYDAGEGIPGPIPGRLVRDLDTAIHYLEPDQTSFYSFLTAITGKETKNVKFEWLEKEHMTRRCDIAAGGPYTWIAFGAVAKVDIPVAATSLPLFQNYSVIWFPRTGHLGEVIDINVALSQITLRGAAAYIGATEDDTATDSESMIELAGTSFPEHSGRGEMTSTQATNPWNYTGISKTEISLSGTAAASVYFGGDEWAIETTEALINHKKDLEGKCLWGHRDKWTDTSGPKKYPVFSSAGIYERITTNVVTHATLNNWKFRSGTDNLIDDGKTIFRYGSKQKLAFVGLDILAHIQKQEFFEDVTITALSEVRQSPSGFMVQNLAMAMGTLTLAWHKRFEGIMSRWMLIVDPDYVRRRPMRSRDTKLRMLPWIGEDSVDAEIMTDIGLQTMQEKTHSRIEFTALV